MNAYSKFLKVNLLPFLKTKIHAHSLFFFFKAVSLPLNIFLDVDTFYINSS